MARRRKRGLSDEGQEALSHIEARQRSWVVIPLAESREVDGHVVVMAPKFRGRAGRALVRLFRQPQEANLHLDEYGTVAWGLMDGERDIGQIADAMVESYGEEAEPSLQRLLMFLRSLQNAGAVRVVTVEKAGEDFN